MTGHPVLLSLGGTIAWDDAAQRMLPAAELATRAGCTFADATDVAAVPSYELTVPEIAALARSLTDRVERGATAVVVTTGTDTLEELAWTCELLATPRILGRAGVAITGAMRFLDDPQTDGLDNLRAALQLATSEEGRAYGVRVAIGGEVFGPRGLRKRDARALHPFDGCSPQRHPRLPDVTGFEVDTGVVLRKVGAISMGGVPKGDVAGVVLEGLGAAHIPSRVFPVIERLQEACIPVVLASRSRSWFRRSDDDPWILEAGDLTAEQAAIALMVALPQTRGWPALRAWWHALEEGST